MYADDTTIYASAQTSNELETTINMELIKLAKWVSQNKLALNTLKTNCMIIGSNYNVSIMLLEILHLKSN